LIHGKPPIGILKLLKFLIMKKLFSLFPVAALAIILSACNNTSETAAAETNAASAESGGQEAVQDDVSQKDVVKIAVGSKDHSTLVAALKQAEYVDDLSNAGPFTVFAPTNDAFNKLPAGTVDGLMKADKKGDLQNILEYHVAVGVYKTESFQDGQNLGMANGQNITVSVKEGKVLVNGTANVVASIPAANGIIHVIDAVLLPPAKN
jgi:uncharacterized surface protein with fasciclin (FAS1) repeats